MAGIPDDVRALFEAPNFIHLATLTADGSPASVAIWGGVEDDRIAFFTQPESAKAVLDHENPYRTARIRGHVAETLEGDEALAVIDRLSHSYTGHPFPMRSGTVYLVEVEHAAFMELPFRHEPPSGG